MRIAVTGTSGQVARSLIERAALAGVEVVAIGRPQLDLTRQDTVLAAIAPLGADVIVSAAAYTAVDAAESNRDMAFAVNRDGAGYVAAAAHSLGVPLLHLSTDYVFDGALEQPYREDDVPGPASIYGASKLGGEEAVLSVGGPVAIMRTAWVYSPYGRNFAKTMAGLARDRREVRVVADQTGCPTSALDIADVLIAAARRLVAAPDDHSLWGVFHVAGSESTTWHAFAQGIFDVLAAAGGPHCTAVPIDTSEYPTPARRPANSCLDCTKLDNIYGIKLSGWRDVMPAIVARIASGT